MVYYRKNKLRILLITDLYPPDPGGRSEKMLRHVKYFLKRKVNIDILCPATYHAPITYYIDSNKNDNICWRVPSILSKHLLSLKWQENFMPQTSLGKLLFKFKLVPLGYLRWIIPAYLFAKKLILERKIKLIITVSNPVTMLLLGILLKLVYPHIKYVAELRDPVTSYYRSKSSNFLGNIIERILIRYADLIIEWKDFSPILLKDKYKLNKTLYSCIENVGFDPDEWINYQRSFNLSNQLPLRFIYTGGYYGEVQLWELVFSSISKLVEKGIAIYLEYFGDWTNEQQYLLKKFPLLNKKVSIYGRVEKKICINKYEKADALLYLLDPNKENIFKVTSKVYDYIATSKPIIGILPKDSVAETILIKYNPDFIVSLPLSWYNNFEYFKKKLMDKMLFLYKIKKESKDLRTLINYPIISNFSCEKSENMFINTCLRLLYDGK